MLLTRMRFLLLFSVAVWTSFCYVNGNTQQQLSRPNFGGSTPPLSRPNFGANTTPLPPSRPTFTKITRPKTPRRTTPNFETVSATSEETHIATISPEIASETFTRTKTFEFTTRNVVIPPAGVTLPGQAVFKKTEPVPQAKMPQFTKSAEKGAAIATVFKEEVEKLGTQGVFADPSEATGRHQSLMNGTREQEEIALDALAIEHLSKFMVSELPRIDNVQFLNTPFGRQRCHPYPTCDPSSPYRTYDGSCNNENNFLVGKASTPVIRLLPDAYEDGFFVPRTHSIDGSPLFSPRTVSQAIALDIDRTETVQTLMTMQWGQFIDHDFILSPTSKVTGYGGAICCDRIRLIGGVFTRLPNFGRIHPECFTIAIDKNDTFFSQFNKECMDFVRTIASPNIHCTMGPREQINAVTHFLDGSMVYGTGKGEADSLRTFQDGKLKTQADNLLPQGNGCPSECFKAGDHRANEQIGLAFAHTLFVREHNRLAEHFKSTGLVNDEEIYQKARRVVIAEIQHITFHEFLPIVLGEKYMEHNNMSTTPFGEYYEDYDEWLDPSISNVFGAAAYRFGHSLIQGVIEVYNSSNIASTYLPFQSQVFNPVKLFDGVFVSGIARGLVAQGSQIPDPFFDDTITNHLFQESTLPFGLDLVALNIQRGRDHGLPSYKAYREDFCDLPSITDFEDLGLPPEGLNAVKSVYKHVDDIDVFIGMFLEQAVDDALLGPTFRCIIGNQFQRLKKADRYFYDYGGQPKSFTIDELDALKRVSLARVLCDNVDDFTTVQPFAFYKPNDVWNAITSCSDITELDLSVFF